MIDNKFIYGVVEVESDEDSFVDSEWHVIDTGGSVTYCGIDKARIYDRKYTTKADPEASLCRECQAENKERLKEHYGIKDW